MIGHATTVQKYQGIGGTKTAQRRPREAGFGSIACRLRNIVYAAAVQLQLIEEFGGGGRTAFLNGFFRDYRYRHCSFAVNALDVGPGYLDLFDLLRDGRLLCVHGVRGEQR